MTVKEIIDKLSEYNREAKFNIVVDGFERPFIVCFGCSDGCTTIWRYAKLAEEGDSE